MKSVLKRDPSLRVPHDIDRVTEMIMECHYFKKQLSIKFDDMRDLVNKMKFEQF